MKLKQKRQKEKDPKKRAKRRGKREEKGKDRIRKDSPFWVYPTKEAQLFLFFLFLLSLFRELFPFFLFLSVEGRALSENSLAGSASLIPQQEHIDEQFYTLFDLFHRSFLIYRFYFLCILLYHTFYPWKGVRTLWQLSVHPTHSYILLQKHIDEQFYTLNNNCHLDFHNLKFVIEHKALSGLKKFQKLKRKEQTRNRKKKSKRRKQNENNRFLLK